MIIAEMQSDSLFFIVGGTIGGIVTYVYIWAHFRLRNKRRR